MIKRLLILTIPLITWAAFAAGSATAATAHTARPVSHSSNCDVNTAYCNFLANYSSDWWAYGTLPQQAIISSSSSTQWWAGHQEATGWYLLENKNGACLNVVSATAIGTSGCEAADTREWFHFSSGPSGSLQVENYWNGAGSYMWIDNTPGVDVELVSGQLAGNELYMRA